MGDVKWIKIVVDIFDDEKILLIESMPEADSLIVIWFKLLCLAGKQNNHGVFVMNDRIAYTDKMLATIFRRKESTVQLALKTFEEFGMIEVVNGAITIPNWGKHQALDKLEKKNEYMREYMREYRERQRAQLGDGKTECKSNSKVNVNEVEEEIDKEKDREEDKEMKKDRINYQEIIDLYNEICISFPSVRSLSDARKKAIRARLNNYSIDDFRRLFEMAERSVFLKGGNDRNWSANFDWLIKDSNMAKVLDGNYEGGMKNGRNGGHQGSVGEVHKPRWRIDADVG